MDLLTKTEKYVLSVAVKLTSNEGGALISSNNIPSLSSEPNDYDIFLACKNLHKNGYIDNYNVTLCGETEFTLTHKGLRYKEFGRLQLKSFIFRSILTPIGASIVTALITTAIALWLKEPL